MFRRRAPRVQYRAVVRFSIFDPTRGGWLATKKGTFDGPDDLRAQLWSEGRLGSRMHLFGQLASPIYQQIAAEHDFRVLVQHSADLPEPWLGRLEALATSYPVLRLAPLGGWVEARDTVQADLDRDGRTGPVVMLRVDDDDLLAADYLDQLAPYVTPDHHGWAISLSGGVVARLEDRRLLDFRTDVQPFGSMGQTFVGDYDARRRTLDLPVMPNHRRVHEYRPTVVDSREITFLQVRHADQDTRLRRDREAEQQVLRTQMAKLPPVTDFAPLRAKFPTLAGAFDEAQETLRP